MILKELKPRKALNKAFLKVKPNRTEIEGFKAYLINLLDGTNDKESEEFHKNLVSDFLKDTYYKQKHFINTKGRNDLVIHNGPNADSTVGVIIEAKKPTNKAEMMSVKKINVKAFHELLLYYLRERITHKNLEVKHLVATNINEWYIFDATLFERLFAQNKNLVKQFNDFEGGRLADNKTDFFYKQIAEPFIESISSEIEFTYFNIQDFQKALRNNAKADDNSLIALFKLLSPEHLLKLPFTNDSNSLDKRFYIELLHIMGLIETKEGGKKLINRNKEGERHTGSLLEDAIIQLDSLDKLNRLEKPLQFGNTPQERLFNVALELSITWINRILFLKLLEAQLITYHKGDKSFSFLNLEKIKNYDDLNSLFFQVLARKYDERNEDVKKIFEKVPYLNSSLFEPTDIEQVTLFISNLKDEKTIPIFPNTVLKDQQGKKRTGNLSTLQYLFEFLDAYDFGAEGGEEIQEDNKTLINASVLGLIFEKINGYKDGSFFTPGFITMYMCRETIRRAVVQKFDQLYPEYTISTLEEIHGLIPQKISKKKANEIINSLKICDPAVGSGHFLVSALNEIISIKNDLKILEDKEGKSLHRYEIEVVNDELIVTDEDGKLFEYTPNQKESQRVQETLFHEKQTIIENCLFGVDINSNSVKICRLRLWIELLKNAYYKNETELETLPNIDINIKCGNSLVSRFAIDVDLKQALQKSKKWTIDGYRVAVATYRNAENKEQKREMERLITDIKSNFRSEIAQSDPKIKKLQKLEYEYGLLVMPNFFQEDDALYGNKDNKKKAKEREIKLLAEINKLKAEIEEIKANKIFENAFEWRFEFPEVLNDDGDFVGFDVVIGNPPYIVILKSTFGNSYLEFFNQNYTTAEYNPNTYALFIELAVTNLLKNKGQFSYIIPNSWLNGKYFTKLRAFLQNLYNIELINLKDNAFEVIVETVIIISENQKTAQKPILKEFSDGNKFIEVNKEFEFGVNPFFELQLPDFVSRIIKSSESIKNHCFVYRGVETRSNDDYISNAKHNDSWKETLLGKDVHRYSYKYSGSYVKFVPKELKSNANIHYYLRDKILMRRTGNSIIACADFNKFIALKNLYLIIPNDAQLLPLILLQLNSKLFDFIHKSLTTGENKAFAQFPAHYIETLPCRIDNALIEKSKMLLQLRETDENVENQIDQLVYELYGLTEEEIKTVEGGQKVISSRATNSTN
ncbi:MAG: Eco57I restriction-modification methylase domain-containing protein [Flavobacteriales bacterium]|jgi:adenine-specific DNA-methyltransferase